MRAVLAEVGSSLPITQIGTMESHLGEALTAPRTAARLMGVFGLLALILASLGIYAVVSFAVARRSAELGIRITLGAASQRIIGMVVGETLRTVGLGLVVGLVVALAGARALGGVLFGIGALDPLTFVSGTAILMAAAALASWVPACRAARADPTDVLRGGRVGN